MWREWRPDIVEQDLMRLSGAGIQWLRVFPLWPDFQPIQALRGHGGALRETRLGEDPLPHDPVGQSGVSAEMLGRFEDLCTIAQRCGIGLVVGLITGWMSGRLFVPAALEGLDPITSSTSITWQIKFVRAFVGAMKAQPAIIAWDLGNECNCMGSAATPDDAFLWTAAISDAIRSTDALRPVVSGMHSLSIPGSSTKNSWLIDDQATLTDVLTTHPYPYWIRYTDLAAVNDFRTTLHATAESRFYGDVAGRPCIAEEIGTMGPMIASDEVSAGFVRVNMWSLWANDCRSMAWWCAHDQTELAFAPYDWNGVELELGLLRTDGSPKPALTEIAAFQAFRSSLSFDSLTKPVPEAVCILSRNQDDWAVAYGSFILATQAKLQLTFRHVAQDIPHAPVYLLPSITGQDCVPRRVWLELLDRVRAGATLYMSMSDGIVPGFNAATGVTIRTRAQHHHTPNALFPDGTELALPGGDDLEVVEETAEVLARRSDSGSPAFWRNRLGSGWVYVFAAPIEDQLSRLGHIYDSVDAAPYWHLYRAVSTGVEAARTVQVLDPDIAVTEHQQPDGATIICAINHTDRSKSVQIALSQGATLGTVWRGTHDAADSLLHIAALDAAVFEVRRRPSP